MFTQSDAVFPWNCLLSGRGISPKENLLRDIDKFTEVQFEHQIFGVRFGSWKFLSEFRYRQTGHERGCYVHIRIYSQESSYNSQIDFLVSVRVQVETKFPRVPTVSLPTASSRFLFVDEKITREESNRNGIHRPNEQTESTCSQLIFLTCAENDALVREQSN